MAKFTKKMQDNAIRLIALQEVQLESYKISGEIQPDATLQHVAYLIDSLAFFKRTSLKQINTVKAISEDEVLLTIVSASPDGSITTTREVVLTLLGMGSHEFLNAM